MTEYQTLLLTIPLVLDKHAFQFNLEQDSVGLAILHSLDNAFQTMATMDEN